MSFNHYMKKERFMKPAGNSGFQLTQIDLNWLIQRKMLHPVQRKSALTNSLITGPELSAIV